MNFILWVDGAEHGPYDAETLHNYIQSGDVSSKVLARLETSEDWKPLELILPKAAVSRKGRRIVCECPRCGADAVQRARVLYESGITSFSGQTTGGGFSFGEDGVAPVVGRGISSGTTRTALSKRFAPPQPKKEGSAVPLATLSGLFFVWAAGLFFTREPNLWAVGVLVVIAIGLGAGATGLDADARKARIHNKDKFPLEFAAWENSWFCHRCGYFGPLA